MFYEKIEITAAELNAAAYQAKDIDVSHSAPNSVRVTNTTGATVNFLVMTTSEYNAWVLDNTITDFMQVADDGTEIVNDLHPKASKIVVLGTTGHTESLYVELIK